jgi:hypothetical protein
MLEVQPGLARFVLKGNADLAAHKQADTLEVTEARCRFMPHAGTGVNETTRDEKAYRMKNVSTRECSLGKLRRKSWNDDGER